MKVATQEARSGRQVKMNRDEMIAIIEKGKDKMPAFEKELTKEQIAAIIDYILRL